MDADKRFEALAAECERLAREQERLALETFDPVRRLEHMEAAKVYWQMHGNHLGTRV